HRFKIKGCIYLAILPLENKKVTSRPSPLATLPSHCVIPSVCGVHTLLRRNSPLRCYSVLSSPLASAVPSPTSSAAPRSTSLLVVRSKEAFVCRRQRRRCSRRLSLLLLHF
ncbi:hypothetical protein S245_024963, partial [Arachis hypogaea]